VPGPGGSQSARNDGLSFRSIACRRILPLGDKTAGVTCSSAAGRFGQISVVENGKAVLYPRGAFETGDDRNSLRLTFHPCPPALMRDCASRRASGDTAASRRPPRPAAMTGDALTVSTDANLLEHSNEGEKHGSMFTARNDAPLWPTRTSAVRWLAGAHQAGVTDSGRQAGAVLRG